jgi:integrase
MAIERRQTKKGEPRYLVRIFRGVSADGKRLELHKTFSTKKEAARWEVAQRRALDTGTFCEPTAQLLGSYMKSWLSGAAKVRVRNRTWHHYSAIVERTVLPARIAASPIARLSPLELEGFYAELLARGLSPRSVRYTHSLIHNALKKATRDRLIPFNPASDVELPRQPRKETRALSAEEVQLMLHTSEIMQYDWNTDPQRQPGNVWHALWHLLVNGGLRPSEALGLRWSDVGVDRVFVRHTLVRGIKGQSWSLEEPKTSTSRRAVALPASTMAAINDRRMRQEIDKVVAGSTYQDLGFVFASAHGTPADLHNITKRHFVPLLQAAGLPKIRVYDLRHTHASLMLAAGVPVKVVSERLGHASAVMTLNTYAHVLAGQHEDAVTKYEKFLVGDRL